MKRYEVKKNARNFGYKCDWYDEEQLKEVEAVDPRHMVGGKSWPAAYFVEKVETVKDEMFKLDTYRFVVAGPFSCEAAAQKWVDTH